MSSEKPSAYLHTMTYETGEQTHRVTLDEYNPFGEAGVDYSEEYPVETTPLYAAQPASEECPTCHGAAYIGGEEFPSSCPDEWHREGAEKEPPNTRPPEALKPCPFCGCDDIRHDHPNRAPRVYCSRCRSTAVCPEFWNARGYWVLHPDEARLTEPTSDQAVPTGGDGLVGAEGVADAVAQAINSIGVAYSHDTDAAFQTVNRKWRVHERGGNPFERDEWLGEFDNKEDAQELARTLRRERATAAVLSALRDAPSPPGEVEADGWRAKVEQIARFVEGWNGDTHDADSFLLAEEIREQFGTAAQAGSDTPRHDLERVMARETQLLNEVEALRAMLVDDPNDVSAGVPEALIDIGVSVLDTINANLQNYVSGETTDWDEGMHVAAIFKAMLRAALERSQP